MKRILIVVLTLAAAAAGYLWNPDPAECQVGAPCGAGTQASITLVAPEAPEWPELDPAPTFDYDNQVSNESTTPGYTFVDADGATQAVAGGALPTGTYTYTCADAYTTGCIWKEEAGSGNSFSIIEVEGPEPDCRVPGTSGDASAAIPAPIVYAPAVGCAVTVNGIVPAPPNDVVTFTADELFTSPSADVDGWAATFSTPVPYTNPGGAAEWDNCLANLGPPTSADTLITIDKDWATIHNEMSPAPAATGLCCVTETAFGTPEQAGCIYRGDSLSVEVTGYLSRCSAEAAPSGGDAGLGANDLCVTVIEAVDTNNVCPDAWCNLNPGDPLCGGGP
jgi:hypothetical protein